LIQISATVKRVFEAPAFLQSSLPPSLRQSNSERFREQAGSASWPSAFCPLDSCQVAGSCDGGDEEPLKRRQRIGFLGRKKTLFSRDAKTSTRFRLRRAYSSERDARATRNYSQKKKSNFLLTRCASGLCYRSCDKRVPQTGRSSLGSGLSWFQRLSVDY
jgi:hypothetical protein